MIKKLHIIERSYHHDYILPCLSIAAKMRELESRKIDYDDPEFAVFKSKISDLNRFSAEFHRRDEIHILQALEWNLCFVTVHDYVAKYTCIGMLLPDDSLVYDGAVCHVANMPSEHVQILNKQINTDCQTIVMLLVKFTGHCMSSAKIALCVIIMSRLMSMISRQK